jgi:MoaA/NifB/PqqE/SkfB family radical SAM enzyme
MANISWHIEPTSKCILECPLCDRTWFYEKFKKRLSHEINIEHLLNFFKGTSPFVSMCGNNGDPIYHSEFHKLCRELKKINSTIEIVTNGSGKKKEWWEGLCYILSSNDNITFSIDGLEDTNHLYRVNAKWNSIMDAINTVVKYDIDTTWKFIVFKHNQHQIEDAKKLSLELGIKNFDVVLSDRWWKKDLMPDEKYVDRLYKHQLAVTKGEDKATTTIIKQQCMKVINGEPNRGLYIDVEGDFYPCCKTGLYAFRYKTIFSPRTKKYNIKNNTIEQILEDTQVKQFFESTKSYETADKCCKIYCGVNNG